MASRQGLQTLLLYRVLLAFTITVLPFPAHDTVQFPGLVLCMNSLQCQLARHGSLLVATNNLAPSCWQSALVEHPFRRNVHTGLLAATCHLKDFRLI